MPVTEPKAFENIMLRVPPKLKERMAQTAEQEQVSQNTLLTASLFLSTLAWGKMPIIGPPDNVLKLLHDIDKAVDDADHLAYGAFNQADWPDVERFILIFADNGFVRDFQYRTDAAATDTIAYRFHFTKLGASIFPLVTWIIRLLIEGKIQGPVQGNPAGVA